MSNELVIYADGACSNNNKAVHSPGGYCAILTFEKDGTKHEMIVSGYEPETTNNRMELTALLKGLQAIKSTSRIDLRIKVVADSSYVIDGFAMLDDMIAANYRKKSGGAYKNSDLWNLIDQERQRLFPRVITLVKVEGHSGNPGNERADKIARGLSLSEGK